MSPSRLLSHHDVHLFLCAFLLLLVIYASVMCTCFGTLSFRKANALFREYQHLEHRYEAILQRREDVLHHISGSNHRGEHDQVALLEEQLVRVDGELDVIEKRLQDFDERHSRKRLKKIRKTAWSWPKGREFSEYVPGPPSPSDLKAPLPDKFSVGKNNRLKAVLFEYDLLAGSPSNRGRWGANGDSRVPTSFENNTTTKRKNAGGFQPLSVSGENLIDEITGLLGKARSAAGLNDNSLQDKGRNLMADLKNKMGESGPSETPHPKQSKSPQPSRHAQSSDPAAKYREKLRERTVGLSREESASSQPGGDGLLFAAKKTLASSEGVSQSAWMLRKGAGNLLLYLAARSVNLGVIASPRTSPAEFESFVDQLRQQSVKVRAAISPELLEAEGVEASVAKAFSELGLHGVGSEVLVVGSSDPILRAATAVEMFTARYHPPNTRREGVIQTFVVREIDEVRNVVEQLNGISYR